MLGIRQTVDADVMRFIRGKLLPAAVASLVALTAAFAETRPVSVEPVVEALSGNTRDRAKIGVRFSIQDGWHIYGEQPGEIGMPTELRVGAPAGFTVSRVHFPPAEKFVQQGRWTAYGYSGEVSLWVEVNSPSKAGEDATGAFHIEASWVACGPQLCVPETAAFEVPVTQGPPPGNSTGVDMSNRSS